jgi:hypothetical protein
VAIVDAHPQRKSLERSFLYRVTNSQVKMMTRSPFLRILKRRSVTLTTVEVMTTITT